MGLLGREGGLMPALRRFGAKVAFKLDYYSSAGLPSRLASLEPMFQATMKRLGLQGLHKHLRYATWFRKRLAPWITEQLADAAHHPSPYWSRAVIERLAGDHIAGRKNYLNEINAVLTLQMVERLLLSAPQNASHPSEPVPCHIEV